MAGAGHSSGTGTTILGARFRPHAAVGRINYHLAEDDRADVETRSDGNDAGGLGGCG